MNIIIIGAPGSGKGMQANLLKNKFNMNYISTGNILRNEIEKKTAVSNDILTCMSKGLLINNKILFYLLKKNLKKQTLLDGFPRTLEQAIYLTKIKFKIDYIVKINIDIKILLKRIKYRVINKNTDNIYNILFNQPKIKYIDNMSGSYLISRCDDNYNVIDRRLKEYNKNILKIMQYYLCNNIPIINVNGSDNPLSIFNFIIQEIK